MAAATLDDELLALFIREVQVRTGVHLDAGKAVMLSGRLRRRIRALGLADFDAYLVRLRRDRAEEAEFIHAVTTHKTELFRTPSVWRALWSDWLPGRSGRVRAWSAACSTGEEPASLGIVLQAHADRTPGFRYDILATDISAPVVESARAATFEVAGTVGEGLPFPVATHLDADGHAAVAEAVGAVLATPPRDAADVPK